MSYRLQLLRLYELARLVLPPRDNGCPCFRFRDTRNLLRTDGTGKSCPWVAVNCPRRAALCPSSAFKECRALEIVRNKVDVLLGTSALMKPNNVITLDPIQLSLRQASQLLNCSEKSVRRLAERNLLHPNRSLRHLRFSREDLERFVKTNTQGV